MKKQWNPFEHRIWAHFRESGLENHEDFLLAVSGGLDSMVLLEIFRRLKPMRRWRVAYYHHGDSENPIQNQYRNDALDLIKKFSPVELVHAKSETPLQSEDEFRHARWGFLRNQRRPSELIVTAHHLDDRFETMMLKLLRGTGPEGLVAFRMRQNELFRPLLGEAKVELEHYAGERQIEWLEDPSNKDSSYLRNWLRQDLFPRIDDKIAGGTRNLAKSLFKIVAAVDQNTDLQMQLEGESLNRAWFLTLSKQDQLRALALFLKKHQLHEFTAGQLEEICKRLDKNQKDITFEILGRKWVINASQIMLR